MQIRNLLLPLFLFPCFVFAHYEEVESLLCRYQRAFTVLDVHAGNGDFSFQIAKEFPNAVCVMLESEPALQEFCQRKKLENTILLTFPINSELLQHLSECEHFDVVLLLSQLSSKQPGWQAVIDACRAMGHHVFFGTPSFDLPLQEHLFSKGAKALNSTNTLFYLESPSIWTLQRKTWMRSCMTQKDYRLTYSFLEKQFEKPLNGREKKQKTTVVWVPGINLCTFKMCGGAYPTSQQLKKSLSKCKQKNHTDWMMNNMILQGTNIHLIDADDPLGNHRYTDELALAHQNLLDLQDSRQIQHYFWEELLYTSPSDRQIVKFFIELFPPLSLIFEIGSDKIERLYQYLGYGSKIICYHPSLALTADLQNTLHKEGLYFVNDLDLSLDEMILSYGLPHFCRIHVDPSKMVVLIKTLSKPIPTLAWKFSLQNKQELLETAQHLQSIGYKEFNFSIRDVPHLYLSNNNYTGEKRTWISTPELLWEAIEKSATLEPIAAQLWGYAYVRRQ